MAKKKLDILQKLSTVTAAMGNIIDSLTGNSSTDAPSIRAVNEALDNTKNQLLTGYEEAIGNSYSGSASDYGIEIAKASGNYEQEGTPTPESPIEPKFFEPKHVNTNGGNLFDASKIQTTTQGGATVTNNGDGSFTVEGSGSLSSTFSLGTFIFKNIKKGMLYSVVDNLTYPYFYVDVYWGNVYKRNIVNINQKVVSTEITQEDIDNNVEIRVKIAGTSGQLIKQGTFKPIIYQDEDGTWYPFNANSTPLDITLRALPGGVCDTYENGVITRRVGYIEFDGSEDEDFIFRNQAESPLVQIYVNGAKGNTNNQSLAGYLCNKLKELTPDNLWSSIEVNRFSIGVNDGSKCFFSFRVDGVTESIESFKTWLQSNPIKVWYELAEPHTEQVDLPVIPSYFPFTNAWHDSEVEASDLTWNILTQSKGNENKINDLQDEINVVNKRFQAKQLLINNDFQIWQRGTSFEQYDSQYTADMWKATCGVEKVDNGVKLIFDGTMISGQYKRTIQQFIPNSKLYSGKKASIGISIDGVSYEVKGTFLENQDINGVQESIDDLEIVLGWSNSRQMYTLIIRCGIAKTVIINYVDLFEGDIVYPHVRGDEDISLMKCQRRVLLTSSTVMGYTGNDSRYVYIMCEKLKNMIDTPTVTGFTDFVLKIDGVSKDITINNAVANIGTGEICLDVGSGNLESNRNISGFMGALILSCEPL